MAKQDRYERQVLLEQVGAEGQQRLAAGSAVVLGCGALGSMIASVLVRAGVGRLRLVDRDVVEASNLHRQILYDERDVASGLAKAEIAARKLGRVNSEVQLESRVLVIDASNVMELVQDVDVVLDGTDNFEARYLINDACVKLGKPWIYGGVVGTSGICLAIEPGRGPCLRCIFPHPPEPGSLPTPETVGVLGSLPMVIGATQATRALAILLDHAPDPRLVSLNLWDGSQQRVRVLADEDCPACARRRFEFLDTSE